MSQWLRQSTSATIPLGPFVDSVDGSTPEESLTIGQANIRLSKNGAAFAQSNNSAGGTHMENGYYSIPLNTTDTNTLGRLKVAIAMSGAMPVWQEFHIVPSNVWDSYFSSDLLQVDVTQVNGSAINSLISGRIDVTVGGYQSGQAPLQPTVAGRTLDVSTTGEAGLDWGNIGSQSSAVTLSGTTTFACNNVSLGSLDNDYVFAGVLSSATSSTATIDVIASGPSNLNNFYNGTFIKIIVGTGVNQIRQVISYNGGSGQMTVRPNWVTVPDNTSQFVLKHPGAGFASTGITTVTTSSLSNGIIYPETFVDDDPEDPSSSALTTIADRVLMRNLASITGEPSRCLLNAIRFLRNKWSISGTTMTVTKEDDSSTAWTSTLTGTPAADPVTASDPT